MKLKAWQVWSGLEGTSMMKSFSLRHLFNEVHPWYWSWNGLCKSLCKVSRAETPISSPIIEGAILYDKRAWPNQGARTKLCPWTTQG